MPKFKKGRNDSKKDKKRDPNKGKGGLSKVLNKSNNGKKIT